MQKSATAPLIDTTPVIETYHAWIRANCVVQTNSSSVLCVTKWYTITNPSSITIKFHVSDAETVVDEYIVHAAREGETGNGNRICLIAPSAVLTKDVFDTNSTDRSNIRFTIDERLIDESYAYVNETGEIIFAGRNSNYYGHKNISELN